MKKRFLLTIIPAILALTSCGLRPSVNADVNPLKEDVVAHEEIFGAAEEAGKLMPRRAENEGSSLAPQADPNPAKPKIGVQYKYSNDNSTISIRYVAAISSLNVQARWHRGVAMEDSNCPIKFYDNSQVQYKVATKAYRAINNDGQVLIAADLDGDYQFFVVYTLLNVPVSTYQYSFVAAYLELTDYAGEELVSSSVVAVNINQKHHFSFEKNQFNGYFMEGTINGSAGFLALNDTPSGTDHAKKDGFALKAGDHFNIFKWTGNEFAQFGRYHFAKEDTLYYTEIDDSYCPEYCKVGATGTFSITLDSNNMFELTASEANLEIYMETNYCWDGARYAIYLMDSATNFVRWDDLVYDSSINKHKVTINLVQTPVFILCRMNNNAGHEANNWDNRWNQTSNISFAPSTNASNNDHSIFHTIFKITSHYNDGQQSSFEQW